ncbi:MAG: hypothetical protein KIT84_00840 [Labilithrix sp.]|nr:hypothetical protein [Labilithrix sp.]MCW5809530.1 hypothetical protein [Labilithrix sp.]
MKSCAVCGVCDERMLAIVQLRGGSEATLCGSHALMHARSKADLRTVADLRMAFGERRSSTRRAVPSIENRDELAERLQSAFTRERRAVG